MKMTFKMYFSHSTVSVTLILTITYSFQVSKKDSAREKEALFGQSLFSYTETGKKSSLIHPLVIPPKTTQSCLCGMG